jgi:hypothetical protein
MTKIKIIITVTIVLILGTIAILSLKERKKVKPVPSAGNPFVERIEKDIDSLENIPVNVFCIAYFHEVEFRIKDFYKNKRLGKTDMENDQLKDILSTNLFSVYSEKFVNQSFAVFNGTAWKEADLALIEKEYNLVLSNPLLQSNSDVANHLNTINLIIKKYTEIDNFINNCRIYAYTDYSLASKFPINLIQAKIDQAKAYKNSGLGNVYVNKCLRLHSRINEVPKMLYKAQIRYLDTKITEWQGFYTNFNSQSDYANNLYKPLKSELDQLDGTIYNVSNTDSDYNILLAKLDTDSKKAYNYFNK